MAKNPGNNQPTKQQLEEGKKLALQFEKNNGLLPVVVQESGTGEVLMLAYVNEDALEYSMSHKKAAFWSRSRKELWVKGETSGNSLHINEIRVDCDQDALVYKVTLEGDGVCHTTGKDSKHRKACFYRKIDPGTGGLVFD